MMLPANMLGLMTSKRTLLNTRSALRRSHGNPVFHAVSPCFR
jgi:hypothetical protein